MKLEVGMYVRTKYGYIAKITEADDRHIYCDNAITKNWGEEFNILFSDAFEEMVKVSHNIIDLIEVGDYVNGRCVGKSVHNGFIELEVYSYDDYGDDYLLENKDIKSIVTKEQFEAIAYRIGEQI